MPAPPYSTGTSMPIRPSLPISRMLSSGNSPDLSKSAATGAMRLEANSRAIDWICNCSSEKWKSIALPLRILFALVRRRDGRDNPTRHDNRLHHSPGRWTGRRFNLSLYPDIKIWVCQHPAEWLRWRPLARRARKNEEDVCRYIDE